MLTITSFSRVRRCDYGPRGYGHPGHPNIRPSGSGSLRRKHQEVLQAVRHTCSNKRKGVICVLTLRLEPSLRTLLGVDLKECLPPTQTSSSAIEPPTPIIKDENISIFAVPITPSQARRRSSASSSVSTSSARKRSCSPTAPSSAAKRVELSRGTSSTSAHRSLAGRSSNDADEATRLRVLQSMFRPPGVAYPSEKVNQYTDVDFDNQGTSTIAPVQNLPYHLPRANYPPSVVCYIAVGHAVRGKFDVQKTLSLGVPKGPLWAKLGKGEIVMTPDGKEVKPEMCLGPSRPPTVC